MLAIDKDNYAAEVEQSALPVLLDFWGPQCGKCLQLMPDVEKLAAQYEGKIKFAKFDVTGNRRMCIQLKVLGLPTILFYKNGEIVDRITGEDMDIDAIKAKAEALL